MMRSPTPLLTEMGSIGLMYIQLHVCLREMSPCSQFHSHMHGLHQGRLLNVTEDLEVWVEGWRGELAESFRGEKKICRMRTGGSCVLGQKFCLWRPCCNWGILWGTLRWWVQDEKISQSFSPNLNTPNVQPWIHPAQKALSPLFHWLRRCTSYCWYILSFSSNCCIELTSDCRLTMTWPMDHHLLWMNSDNFLKTYELNATFSHWRRLRSRSS